MNIAKIRNQFPNPVRYVHSTNQSGAYCVGGAFCMAHGINEPFPVTAVLSSILRLHFKITAPQAAMFADEIATANDAGNYEEAWTLLESLEHLTRGTACPLIG